MLVLDEDEYFSMQANVESPGYQRIALRGYIKQTRQGETWIAPLIPQLFYGVTGAQLSSWRQNFTATGPQTILSRSGGYPKVPREQLWWRRVDGKLPEEVEKPTVDGVVGFQQWWNDLSQLWKGALLATMVAAVVGGAYAVGRSVSKAPPARYWR